MDGAVIHEAAPTWTAIRPALDQLYWMDDTRGKQHYAKIKTLLLQRLTLRQERQEKLLANPFPYVTTGQLDLWAVDYQAEKDLQTHFDDALVAWATHLIQTAPSGTGEIEAETEP